MTKNVVVVESPAKAKTINKYLGNDYVVIASIGHVRDLPSKDGSVNPDDNFAMQWQMNDRSKKQMNEITKALKSAERIVLATDPDREGEAISWHIFNILNDSGKLKNIQVQRVTFNAITKSAVLEAFDHARDIDSDLVDAYLARRALDYLVGFNLSPVLWRKLPGSKSAGRVQSVALRLICERETEIETFDPREYWTVQADCLNSGKQSFTANLTHLKGQKLDKFALNNDKLATDAAQTVENADLSVLSVETKQTKRNPAAPFITSTLQQEASRKLGFGASRTMKTAQSLYEAGLITYMRTDGPTLSGEAIAQARAHIESEYGGKYLPGSPRQYKAKAKNSQEAHEAIRPTNIASTPEKPGKSLSSDEFKLYSLIWKRTVASQMEAALIDQVGVDIGTADKQTVLRATGSTIAFDGFIKLYREDHDEDDKNDNAAETDENGNILPPLKQGEDINAQTVIPEQHFTQPPPRYSEASLVKKLEELGIGRPSTYASIIQVLQDRDYVRVEQRRFFPEDRGRVVTAFLQNFFAHYVEYDFTADLENKLDDIAEGKIQWRDVLSAFWKDFSAKVDETKELRIQEVIRVLNQDLEEMLYPLRADGSDRRSCPMCKDGRISLKLGKFGGFIGCSNHPECSYTRPLVENGGDEAGENTGPRELGTCPENGRMVTARPGPYGAYVQMEIDPDEIKKAEAEAKAANEEAARKAEEKGKKPPKEKKAKLPKPKRVGLPRGKTLESVTLEEALELLSLPREVGEHPETGKMIIANLGKFGPYLQYDGVFVSIPKDEDLMTIGMNRAVDLIAEKQEKNKPLRIIGDHPEDGEPITVQSGRWGPFLKHGKSNAPLSKNDDYEGMTLQQAIKIINEKGKPSGRGGKKKASSKKAAMKKTATKKKTTAKKKK